jgi:hypothetical protein
MLRFVSFFLCFETLMLCPDEQKVTQITEGFVCAGVASAERRAHTFLEDLV